MEGVAPRRCNRCKKVELSSTSCNVARNKNVARQVAEVTCYTVQFFSNWCRNAVARQVAEKITQCITPPSILVGHRIGIAEVMGSNPVGASAFFLGFLCNGFA